MTGAELMERVKPLEHRLPNGLTVLVRADHASPVAAVVTHVRAGYFDEPDRLAGISHVLEHMYFKGTARRGVGEIARATKAAGGYLNAGTIYDRTSYYTVLPASELDEGLDLQADALIHSRIDEDELRKELVVIIEEVKRKLDNPSALATEKLYEAMFDAHPIRRWRMGSPEALERFTRDDVLSYYRDMYRAGNIVLVVAGAVDPDRVVRRVEELYGEVPPGGGDRPGRSEPARDGARIREMSGDIARTHAELGWRTPGALHHDTPALDALATVSGQGRAARLYRGVRERGLASGVGSFNYTPTELGVFGVGLECEPDRTAAALGATWRELDRLRREPVSGEELFRVRTLFEARLLRRLETAEGRANLLAEWQALGHWSDCASYLDRVQELTPDRLRDVAERYLQPDGVTLLVYRPATAPAMGWLHGDVTQRLREAASSEDDGRRPTVMGAGAEDGGEGAPDRDEGTLPVLSAPVVLTGGGPDDEVVRYPLGRGHLVVQRRSHAPLVSMAVARTGGAVLEGPATAGLTGLVVRSALKGTATRRAEDIAMDSERLGASIAAAAGPDLASWSLTVPSAHFAEGLSLLADVTLHPSFPDDAVATERDMALAGLDRLRDDMYSYPIRLLLKAAFGGHAYGLGVEETVGALGAATADDVRRWHAVGLAEPWVFVVGDVEPDRVADAVAAGFPIPAANPTPAPESPRWPDVPRREEVRRDKAQTALALAFPGPPRNHRDRTALEVLAGAISGLGNRLFEELRSRRSLAYTVTTYPMLRRQGGAFVGYIATSPDRAEEARLALLQELGRLRTEPPDEDELDRAKRYAIGSWLIRTQTNSARLSELVGALMIGEGMEEIREMEARTRAVTRDDLLEVAARWFDAARLAEGVVRGGAPAD
jgi:zinc protease